jgi:CRP-like cAMP-binding protein
MKESPYIGENKRLINLLKKIERFNLFSDEDIRRFLELAKLKEYDAGEVIMGEGEADTWLYFLIGGAVEIVKDSKVIGYLHRTGDIFGEMGVIDGSPRSATVLASDKKAVVIGVDASLVDRRLREKDISFAYTMYRLFAEILAVRLRHTTEENVRLLEENRSLKKRLTKRK